MCICKPIGGKAKYGKKLFCRRTLCEWKDKSAITREGLAKLAQVACMDVTTFETMSVKEFEAFLNSSFKQRRPVNQGSRCKPAKIEATLSIHERFVTLSAFKGIAQKMAGFYFLYHYNSRDDLISKSLVRIDKGYGRLCPVRMWRVFKDTMPGKRFRKWQFDGFMSSFGNFLHIQMEDQNDHPDAVMMLMENPVPSVGVRPVAMVTGIMLATADAERGKEPGAVRFVLSKIGDLDEGKTHWVKKHQDMTGFMKRRDTDSTVRSLIVNEVESERDWLLAISIAD